MHGPVESRALQGILVLVVLVVPWQAPQGRKACQEGRHIKACWGLGVCQAGLQAWPASSQALIMHVAASAAGLQLLADTPQVHG